MKTVANIVGALVGLALIAAFGYYGYFGAKRFVVLFARLEFTTAMVTATAALTLLAGAAIIAGSIRRASAKGRESQLRFDKAETYKLFITVWEEMLRPGQTAEMLSQLSRQMRDLNRMLLLHGCPAMVKIQGAMPGLNLAEARDHLADAIVLIRKELGIDSRGLDAADLLRLVMAEAVTSPVRQAPPQDTQPRVSLAPN